MRAVTACVCKGASKPTHGDGIVRVSRETKGRAGKGVTLVSGVPIKSDALEKLATQLKKRCGTGGTVKDTVIEIQGDHRDTLMAELTKLGFKVKRVGG
jgi:translation initiation factor 1